MCKSPIALMGLILVVAGVTAAIIFRAPSPAIRPPEEEEIGRGVFDRIEYRSPPQGAGHYGVAQPTYVAAILCWQDGSSLPLLISQIQDPPMFSMIRGKAYRITRWSLRCHGAGQDDIRYAAELLPDSKDEAEMPSR